MAAFRCVCFCAVLGCVSSAERARAHGKPPEALSVVSGDERSARIVRLNEGFARSTAEGFRYVCPALFGEDTVVPAGAIPGGPAIVGASTGLFVMRQDGSVMRHPDARAAGRVLALSSAAAGLFALRQAGDLYELLRVYEDRVEVLWNGLEPFYELAAADDFLHLVRLEAGRLHELKLSFDGEVRFAGETEVPESAAAVLARASGSAGYVVLLTSGLDAELGRVDQGSWRSLATGRAFAGPIATAEGSAFVAVDGELAAFDGEQPRPVGEPARVTCLRAHGALRYACSDGGLHVLGPAGLGAELFALDQLLAPDLTTVPAEQRARCELQWQRFEIDLRSIGIEPRAASERDAGPDGGSSAMPDSGATADAGAQPSGARDAGARPAARRELAAEGCGCRIEGSTPAAGAAFGGLALPALLAFRRCRRCRRCRQRRR